jgi:hypothetical protein
MVMVNGIVKVKRDGRWRWREPDGEGERDRRVKAEVNGIVEVEAAG